MSAIDTLMQEHRIIEKGLDALVAFVETLRRPGAGDDKAELLRFVSFIREFADRHHHGKEEKILFVKMVDNGFPKHTGPIAVMLHEHDEGRALVSTLGELGEKAEPWTDEDRQGVVGAAHGFASMLRAHIQKEDQILYPMAESRLAAPVMDEVDRRVAEFEADDDNRAARERLLALAEELAGAHGSAA